LEVSGNYSIIVPVIVANTVAYVISRSLQPVPIFDVLTRQDGLVLPSLEEQREEQILRVEDAMQPPEGPVLHGGDPVEQASTSMGLRTEEVFLFRMEQGGWSIVSRDLLDPTRKEGKGNLTLASVLSTSPLSYLYPDLPLDAALRCVTESELIPVVNHANL